MSDLRLSVISDITSADADTLTRLLPRLPVSEGLETSIVPISSLQPGDSPRLAGLDSGHAQALAELDEDLPPILVQRSTMRVIDGMHRLGAAQIRGDDKICVQFFDGTEEDAFLLAVAANIKHGLPLTLADRRTAAARIIQQRPEASDRWIAELAGLAAKTVASIRRESPDPTLHLARRIGRDGRFRPLNSAEGRRIAGELLEAHPEASLRQIARHAGISVGTARDVRDKIRQGLDPVLSKNAGSKNSGQSADGTPAGPRKTSEPVDYMAILHRLQRDPSLRYTESGRSLLRWLCPQRLIATSDWSDIIAHIPSHCTFDIVRIAKGCAIAWTEFADELDQRSRNCS